MLATIHPSSSVAMTAAQPVRAARLAHPTPGRAARLAARASPAPVDPFSSAPPPPPAATSPAASSSSGSTTVIAPSAPLASAASVSTSPLPRPGDPEVFPPPGLPGELVPEWDASVAAVRALLERAAAEASAAAAAGGGGSSSAPARRRRGGGGREEEDAPPEIAAQRHVARAFGWGSQAYWRHSVVGAAPDARRVESALAFLCGGSSGGGGDEGAETRPLGLSAPEAAAVLKSFPELLFLDADARLAANAAQLRRQWRLDGAVLRGAVARNPRALGYDVDCQGSCVGDCHRCWARF